MIIVRYADDWVAGFEHRADAQRFWREVTTRLGQFGPALHANKTRLIEFGRYARTNRRRRGSGQARDLDFGFTHCCGRTRTGKFMVLRLDQCQTAARQAARRQGRARRRMHRPIAEQGAYLRAVVSGHARYFGVPCNGVRLQTFRLQVARLWHRTLCRRTQSHHLS
ncbi:MAG: hypothetical protein U1E86_06870 [Burkholderiaceae bacterium]